jgi:short-subunit dehydrogenase
MALCPGPVPTEFQQAAGIERPSAMRHATLTAERTVEKALEAYEEGRDLCVPGAMNRLSALGAGLLPRTLAAKAAASVMRRSGRD